jgi:iron complex transport system substrate-binding protein
VSVCRLLAVVVALAVGLAGVAGAAARPARVVSLNLCSDILLLLLAERERVASVTWMAADPEESPVAGLARGLPVNHGAAEEVVRLGPDLVVAAPYSARASVALLRALGYPVLELALEDSIAGVTDALRTLGAALGVPERAEAMIADMEARLDALARAAPGAGRATLVYRTGGYTATTPSTVDDLLEVLDLRNIAAGYRATAGVAISVEAVLRARPEVVIVGVYRRGQPSLAAARMSHRALRSSAAWRDYIAVPTPLWACPSPFIVDAGELIAAALKARGEGRP